MGMGGLGHVAIQFAEPSRVQQRNQASLVSPECRRQANLQCCGGP
ncbi:hypothetical protein CHCC14437_3509 [Bacillus licheniformis]|nr:hypothetical protein CHCC14437_3509 [Bacillus licheniformis]